MKNSKAVMQLQRNYILAHPVRDVLNTTSPTCVPEAPNDLAIQIEPSSSTSLASEVFHGLSAKPKAIRLHQLVSIDDKMCSHG